MRWLVAAVALGLAVSAVVVATFLPERDQPDLGVVTLPQDPMPGRLLVGLQDDSSFRWANDRGALLDRARSTGAAVIRTIVEWRTVAPTRPASPRSSFDPAYRLDDLDDLARSAQRRGIELLVTVWGTPAWANGDAGPNRAPRSTKDLEAFAFAIADRYSGRHPGYPAIRLFSAWNEPNLEQFLAPQFDASGRSVAPRIYAGLARAFFAGVKRANPSALVAIGETSPRGRDAPTRGGAQDSHSPPRFARLLADVTPAVPFDAWAQHPYPPRPSLPPSAPARWPRVGVSNLDRFGSFLDDRFGRTGIPLWITEYGHETKPNDPLGVAPALQARFAADALDDVARDARIRMFLWFVFKDRPGHAWQSGLVAEDGSPKPALATFTRVARRLDGRNPVLPDGADVARVPALELAYAAPAGAPIEVSVGGRTRVESLGADGWVEFPVGDSSSVVRVQLSTATGLMVERTVARASGPLELR